MHEPASARNRIDLGEGLVLPDARDLTCTLELRSGNARGEVVYRLGELVSVQCDAGTERAVAQMLEWSEGQYRFVLPSVEVPTVSPASRGTTSWWTAPTSLPCATS